MIENGKVLVYPTLKQTRKECVSEYCSRSGMTASKRAELLAAFDAMHEESIEDYKDYVRRCGGVPISKVKP